MTVERERGEAMEKTTATIDLTGKFTKDMLARLAKAETACGLLLDAAKHAEEWIATVTKYEDNNVPYVNGHYDGFVDLVQARLHQAIVFCEKQKVR